MRLGTLQRGESLAVIFIAAWSGLLLFTFMGAPIFAAETQAEKKEAEASKESFNLILPFKDLTVGQGQEATMDAEVVNRSRQPVEVSLSIDSVPQGWDVNFNSRYPSYPVRSVMVQASDQSTTKSTTLEFKAKVPDNTKPGTYPVKVTAKDLNGSTQYVATVNFRVTSKKVETGGLKLTSQYPVLTTPSGQTLKFTVDLKNETNKPLTASLVAQTPTGWSARFKPQFGDTQISSIQLKENGTESLSVEIDSPARAEAAEHPVTIRARAGAFEASTNIKVTLRGVTDLRIGVTDQYRLNASVTAGQKTAIPFLVGNGGTAAVRNLAFVTKKPDKWTIEFKPDKIDALNPGEVREVSMDVTAPARAIAGDYSITVTANSADANKSIDFRVTVATVTYLAWIGAAIVGAVVLGLAVVFWRLGRR